MSRLHQPARTPEGPTLREAVDAFVSCPLCANPNTRRAYTAVLDRALEVRTEPASDEVAASLNLEPGAEVLVRDRLMYADDPGEPIGEVLARPVFAGDQQLSYREGHLDVVGVAPGQARRPASALNVAGEGVVLGDELGRAVLEPRPVGVPDRHLNQHQSTPFCPTAGPRARSTRLGRRALQGQSAVPGSDSSWVRPRT